MILLFFLVLNSLPWTQPHLTYPVNYCHLAAACIHDDKPVCATNADGCSKRTFLDQCDMYEYNCDHGTRYQETYALFCSLGSNLIIPELDETTTVKTSTRSSYTQPHRPTRTTFYYYTSTYSPSKSSYTFPSTTGHTFPTKTSQASTIDVSTSSTTKLASFSPIVTSTSKPVQTTSQKITTSGTTTTFNTATTTPVPDIPTTSSFIPTTLNSTVSIISTSTSEPSTECSDSCFTCCDMPKTWDTTSINSEFVMHKMNTPFTTKSTATTSDFSKPPMENVSTISTTYFSTTAPSSVLTKEYSTSPSTTKSSATTSDLYKPLTINVSTIFTTYFSTTTPSSVSTEEYSTSPLVTSVSTFSSTPSKSVMTTSWDTTSSVEYRESTTMTPLSTIKTTIVTSTTTKDTTPTTITTPLPIESEQCCDFPATWETPKEEIIVHTTLNEPILKDSITEIVPEIPEEVKTQTTSYKSSPTHTTARSSYPTIEPNYPITRTTNTVTKPTEELSFNEIPKTTEKPYTTTTKELETSSKRDTAVTTEWKYQSCDEISNVIPNFCDEPTTCAHRSSTINNREMEDCNCGSIEFTKYIPTITDLETHTTTTSTKTTTTSGVLTPSSKHIENEQTTKPFDSSKYTLVTDKTTEASYAPIIRTEDPNTSTKKKTTIIDDAINSKSSSYMENDDDNETITKGWMTERHARDRNFLPTKPSNGDLCCERPKSWVTLKQRKLKKYRGRRNGYEYQTSGEISNVIPNHSDEIVTTSLSSSINSCEKKVCECSPKEPKNETTTETTTTTTTIKEDNTTVIDLMALIATSLDQRWPSPIDNKEPSEEVVTFSFPTTKSVHIDAQKETRTKKKKSLIPKPRYRNQNTTSSVSNKKYYGNKGKKTKKKCKERTTGI